MYRIQYSNCWEDAEVVNKALNIKPGNSYLSISSAGDNTLSILAHNPRSVLAVDKNPAQLACLDLRRVAIEHFSHHDTLRFLGAADADNRINYYQQIRKSLAPFTRSFWDQNMNDIKNGIIHAGITEQNFKRFRVFILPLAISRSDQVKLLKEMSRSERKHLCDKTLSKLRYRYTMRLIFNRIVVRQFKIGAYSTFFHSGNGNLAGTVMERVNMGFNSRHVNKNPYVTYIMTGNYYNALPYYLREPVFHTIKKNIRALKLFSGTVQQALAVFKLYTFNGFNLSDIFEYMDRNAFQSCVNQVIRRAAQGARLVYWNTLQMHDATKVAPGQLHRCTDLVQKLSRINKSFFYDSIMIDEVC